MEILNINSELLTQMFIQSSNNLNINRNLVDSLNVFPVPDGDTGTNMSLTLNAAVTELNKKSYKTVSEVAKVMSKGSLMGARGNSGVILSQIFRGFAKACEGKETLSSIDLAHAFKDASETAYKAVMKPVEGTILTVIRKTADKAMEYTDEEVPVHSLLKILIKKAEETLEKTPEYLDVLKQAGVVDAGGKGLVCILEGFYSAVIGEEVAEFHQYNEEHIEHASVEEIDITFGYCTEFIIKSQNPNVEELSSKIEGLGDSMVFVTDDDLVKVHIHTNNPGVALEAALLYGNLINVKIENMREQHSSLIGAPHEVHSKQKSPLEKTKFAFISVSMGDGLTKIFKDLGVNYVIEGGQTMNPSTEDIVKAIGECNAENIFILPNNSNIILAANQAKELIEDKNIFVVPSKNVPQGITSLIEFDHSGEAKENYEIMLKSLSTVKTLQVTYSVRDTVFNDMKISKDDILGVGEGEISSVGKSVNSVSLNSIAKLIDEDSEIMTIYYGEDISEEDANILKDTIEGIYKDLEIEVYYGGQPLYYYIFSIE
ncbi:MAG: DAK2 domain-containing protein [Acidaminobacteraceae bacterium]